MNEERGALFFFPSFFKAEKRFGATFALEADEGKGEVDANVSVEPIAAPLGTKVTEGFGAE